VGLDRAGTRLVRAERRSVEDVVQEAIGLRAHQASRFLAAPRRQQDADGQADEEESDRDPNAAEHGDGVPSCVSNVYPWKGKKDTTGPLAGRSPSRDRSIGHLSAWARGW
jgi:hypothetical protein